MPHEEKQKKNTLEMKINWAYVKHIFFLKLYAKFVQTRHCTDQLPELNLYY